LGKVFLGKYVVFLGKHVRCSLGQGVSGIKNEICLIANNFDISVRKKANLFKCWVIGKITAYTCSSVLRMLSSAKTAHVLFGFNFCLSIFAQPVKSNKGL